MGFGRPAGYLSGRCLVVGSIFRCVIHRKGCCFALVDCLVTSLAYSRFPTERMLCIHLPLDCTTTWSGPSAGITNPKGY